MFSHCVYTDVYTLRHILIAANTLKFLSAFPILIAIFRWFSNLAVKIHFDMKLDIICGLSRGVKATIKKKREY